MAQKSPPVVLERSDEALARAAGIERALEQFPQDLALAARAAANAVSSMPPLDNVAAEPWPPMRMPSP